LGVRIPKERSEAPAYRVSSIAPLSDLDVVAIYERSLEKINSIHVASFEDLMSLESETLQSVVLLPR
jgi:hypothetical protein